jgi:hypothetical protein
MKMFAQMSRISKHPQQILIIEWHEKMFLSSSPGSLLTALEYIVEFLWQKCHNMSQLSSCKQKYYN